MQNGLWVTGGSNPEAGFLETTEIIYVNGTVTPGPTLGFWAFGHCLVEHEGTIYLLGGKQNGVESNATWIYNATHNFDVKEGASMKQQRIYSACGIMQHSNAHSGRPLIVIVGSKDVIQNPNVKNCMHSSRTSEYWDFTVPGSTWQYSSKLSSSFYKPSVGKKCKKKRKWGYGLRPMVQ